MVFNMFIDDWDDRIQNNSFDGNTKLSDDVGKFEGRAVFTERLDGLEEWNSKHCVKLNEDKSPHLKARFHVAGKHLYEKSLEVLEDNKLDPIGQDTRDSHLPSLSHGSLS